MTIIAVASVGDQWMNVLSAMERAERVRVFCPAHVTIAKAQALCVQGMGLLASY
jgi:hypothetical protein